MFLISHISEIAEIEEITEIMERVQKERRNNVETRTKVSQGCHKI